MVELLELWPHITEQVFEDEPPHPPAVACLILNAVCFQIAWLLLVVALVVVVVSSSKYFVASSKLDVLSSRKYLSSK